MSACGKSEYLTSSEALTRFIQLIYPVLFIMHDVVYCSFMEKTEPKITKTMPVSVRLQPALNDQVTAIAEALDRPKSWVIEQAVAEFVAIQEWQLAAIDEGIREADAGRLIPHEDVVAWVQSWDQPNELPMPKWK
jgi:predicted transcriptional regulator